MSSTLPGAATRVEHVALKCVHLVLKCVELGDADAAVRCLPLVDEVVNGLESQAVGAGRSEPARECETGGLGLGVRVGK